MGQKQSCTPPLHVHKYRTQSVPVPVRCFWFEHSSSNFHGSNESSSQTLESKRSSSLCIPRRHSDLGHVKTTMLNSCNFCLPHSEQCRFSDKPKEKHFGTYTEFTASRFSPSRFSPGSQTRKIKCPQGKVENHQKRVGQIGHKQSHVSKKNGCHFGSCQKFFFLTAMPFLRAFNNMMLTFVNQQFSQGWDTTLPIPHELFLEVRQLNNLFATWQGISFQTKLPENVLLHSDASQLGWAAIILTKGTHIGLLLQKSETD